MPSGPLVRYVLLAALRDRLIVSLLLAVVVGASLSLFLGSGALIEKSQFAMVFAASGLRIAGVACLVMFAVFYVRRSFDNKDVEFLLTRPVSRASFIVSHALAFSVLALVVALVIGGALCLTVPVSLGYGHLLWVFSLAMELMIIINAALFFSMVLTSASGAAAAVFGLYVLARLMGQLLGIAASAPETTVNMVMGWVMNGVAMAVPRLDLMTQTTWLVYPDTATQVGIGFIAMQGVLYTGLVVSAALLDLRRRQF